MKPLYVMLLLPLCALAQSTLEQARQKFAAGRYIEAREGFERDFRDNPNRLSSLESIGDCDSHLALWETAVQTYRKLVGLHPESANYQYKYGGAMAMLAQQDRWKAIGLIDDIETAFQKAILDDPKHIEARWALVEYYLQLPGILGGSETKAKRYADELLHLSPVDGYLAKGRIAEYFERYADAEALYLKAHAIGQSATTLKKLQSVYAKMNRPDKAKALTENSKTVISTPKTI